MKVSRTLAWLGRSLGTCALAVGLAGGLGLTVASVASASTGTGYLRLAHLSPNTPAVDVYLYSFGDPNAMVVLHHVGYGDVSPYEAVNSGEYKLMGLAPYGNPDAQRTADFKKKIEAELVDLRSDGSVILNMDYFDFATGLKMANESKWKKLFDLPRRKPESEISQAYMDMALAIQQVTEESVLRLAKTARERTGCNHLVMAGGVALNCVANGKILRAGIFDDIWIQPAAGDAGGALGAALFVWHQLLDRPRRPEGRDAQQGSFLGPCFTTDQVARFLE